MLANSELEAYVDFLNGVGLTLDIFTKLEPILAEGPRLYASIIPDAHIPDGLLCHNNLLALGFIKEADEFGTFAPQHLSVSGFGNFDCGKYLTLALTTIDPQAKLMGIFSAENLLAMLQGVTSQLHTLMTL